MVRKHKPGPMSRTIPAAPPHKRILRVFASCSAAALEDSSAFPAAFAFCSDVVSAASPDSFTACSTAFLAASSASLAVCSSRAFLAASSASLAACSSRAFLAASAASSASCSSSSGVYPQHHHSLADSPECGILIINIQNITDFVVVIAEKKVYPFVLG